MANQQPINERVAVLESRVDDIYIHLANIQERITSATLALNEVGKDVAVLLENMHSGPGAQTFHRTKKDLAKKQLPTVGWVAVITGLIEIVRQVLA